ncbi:hypothetical protein Tco_0017164 [Tanacetum coccineum]
MTRWLTGGPAVVNGGPPSLTVDDRWYEVAAVINQACTTWHWRVSVRGVRVSVRGQACMDPCQSLAIMRLFLECKKSIIPLDPAISLDEDLKGRNCPSHLEAINGACISCI